MPRTDVNHSTVTQYYNLFFTKYTRFSGFATPQNSRSVLTPKQKREPSTRRTISPVFIARLICPLRCHTSTYTYAPNTWPLVHIPVQRLALLLPYCVGVGVGGFYTYPPLFD